MSRTLVFVNISSPDGHLGPRWIGSPFQAIGCLPGTVRPHPHHSESPRALRAYLAPSGSFLTTSASLRRSPLPSRLHLLRPPLLDCGLPTAAAAVEQPPTAAAISHRLMLHRIFEVRQFLFDLQSSMNRTAVIIIVVVVVNDDDGSCGGVENGTAFTL